MMILAILAGSVTAGGIAFGLTLLANWVRDAVEEWRYERNHPGYREWKNQR